MNLTSLWLRIFGAGFWVVAGLVGWTLFTPPFHGDLTRIARLSERDFGWTAPQPALPEAELVSSAMDQADVLVIGDSFSKELIWQSVLVKSGYRVATVSWEKTGPLCADFSQWLQASGFRGKQVIVQSVERELDGHLRKAASCQSMNSGRIDSRLQAPSPHTQMPGFALNWRETLATGLLTWWHTTQTERKNKEKVYDLTRVLPLPEGCTYFSHRRCTQALLLNTDVQRAPLSNDTLAALTAFRQAHADVPLVFAIVPNKTSVYASVPSSFGGSLAAAGLGPDLFTEMHQARTLVKDLYLPNDTHLSTRGYLLLGQRMLQTLKQSPAPRS